MGRFGTLIGLFVCALGSAQQARALSAECTEPLLSGAQDARGEAAYQSTELAVDTFAAVAPSAPLPLGYEDDGELPWCVTPEDPRCSPLPGHSAPSQLALGHFVVSGFALELPSAWLLRAVQPSPARGVPPANGVRHRLERPPRPARR